MNEQVTQSLGLVDPEATELLLPSVSLLRHADLLDRLQDGLASPHLNLDLSKLRCNLLAPVPSFRVALVASLGLLHPQILSLKAVVLKGGRSYFRNCVSR